MVAAFGLSLSSAYKISVFSEIKPVPHFFHLKSLLWEGHLTVKVRKKENNQSDFGLHQFFS